VRIALFTILMLALCAPALAETAAPKTGVRVVVTSPETNSVVRNRTDMAPLAGFAQAGERPTDFDVMLVVDVSGSTKEPSGSDVDGDGEVGRKKKSLVPGLPAQNSDVDDSILAAEVMAGRLLIEGLEDGRVRVGVVSFSGDVDPKTKRRRSVNQADAWLEQTLTQDYEAVFRSLEGVQARGSHGGTNMEAGIKLALRELAGLSGAQSIPREHAQKIILFLTDGAPSLPFGTSLKEDPEDIEAAVSAARLAKAGGARINVFGLGPRAVGYPIAATEMARVTGGRYTPVRNPGDILAVLTGISFANIEDVVAVNLTLGEMAEPDDVLLQPDGSFKGFFPVQPGLNRIRISALASDGSRGSTEFEIEFRHQDLTDAELAAELERIRERNRSLRLVMERERQKRFRNEIQRTLTIEIEGDKSDSQEGESQP